MNITTSLIAMLKTALPGFSVYSGEIPETAERPAVLINNISFGSQRVLSGGKTKNQSVWRITLSDTLQNLQNSLDEIELIDNTTNEYFQRVFVQLTLIEPKALTEPYQRAFFDVTVTPR
jgi:hypothetical protein